MALPLVGAVFPTGITSLFAAWSANPMEAASVAANTVIERLFNITSSVPCIRPGRDSTPVPDIYICDGRHMEESFATLTVL
jgi:hypothetical protein